MVNEKLKDIGLIGFKILLIVVAAIFIWFYFSFSIEIINETALYPINRFLVYFQLFIEFFVLVQTLIMLIGIADILFETASTFETPETLTIYPEVDVFIPIRRVNSNILEKTLVGMSKQSYPKEKLHIFIIDDTPEKELSEEYKQLADKYNCRYIYEPSNIKYKAGMVNLSLPHAKSEYIAFFDYDQIPTAGIITHMVYLLENRKDVVFVQTKKTFRNLFNLSRVWSALLYLQFFEVFERTKNRNKSVMFAGSTACFRRSAIDSVGGIPEDTFTEDNNLTIKLLIDGKIGLFSDRVGSEGTVPDGYTAQISQLWRWSHGGSHTLRVNLKELISTKKANLNQKIDFITTMGITPLLVVVYAYTFSFLPQLLSGQDSPRALLGDVSSIFLIPLLISSTYAVFATLAIWFDRNNSRSEYKFRHLPGFIIISLASNILIFTSGVAGILGKLGPNSKYGQWNRRVPIFYHSLIALVVGLAGLYLGYVSIINGLTAGILIIIMSLSIVPTIFIVLLYDKKLEIE